MRCIKDRHGNMLFEEEEIKNRWEEYIAELYYDQRGDPAPIDTEADENCILLSEVEKAMSDLRTGKAAGPDEVDTELLKDLDKEGVRRIHILVQLIYKTGHIPSDMNKSTFICLPKKPKATLCSEYRTLSLMSHFLKMILHIILLRNRKKCRERN